MKIENFIINGIQELSQQFPEMSFIYGFDKTTNHHLVEVEPSYWYHNDEYGIQEFTFTEQVFELYPNEEIVFINDQKFIKVENPIFTLRGSTIQLPSNAVSLGTELLKLFIIQPTYSIDGLRPSSSLADIKFEIPQLQKNNDLTSNLGDEFASNTNNPNLPIAA